MKVLFVKIVEKKFQFTQNEVLEIIVLFAYIVSIWMKIFREIELLLVDD
jgi:hypothetical protein